MKKTDLFIIFDFAAWEQANSWSYLGALILYDESLKSSPRNTIQIIPADNEPGFNYQLFINFFEKSEFNTIYLWSSHIKLNSKIIDLLKSHSDNLVIILTESLIYSEIEVKENPELGSRLKTFISLFSRDLPILNLCPITNEELLILGYKSVFIYGFSNVDITKHRSALGRKENSISISGKLYNSTRNELFKKLNLDDDSTHGFKTVKLFDSRLTVRIFQILMKILKLLDKIVVEYRFKSISFLRGIISKNIYRVRKIIWLQYSKKISKLVALVSLPSYFKGLPGRIFEALLSDTNIYLIDPNNMEQKLFFKKLKLEDFIVESSELNNFAEKLRYTSSNLDFDLELLEKYTFTGKDYFSLLNAQNFNDGIQKIGKRIEN